jgi:hypothetical protein
MNQSPRPEQQLKADEAVKVVAEAVASMKLDPLSSSKSDEDVMLAKASAHNTANDNAGMKIDQISPKPEVVPSAPGTKLVQVSSSLMTEAAPSRLAPVMSSSDPLAMNTDNNRARTEDTNRNLAQLHGRITISDIPRESLELMPEGCSDMKLVQCGLLPLVMTSSDALTLVKDAATAAQNTVISSTTPKAPSPPKPKSDLVQRHRDSTYMCEEM